MDKGELSILKTTHRMRLEILRIKDPEDKKKLNMTVSQMEKDARTICRSTKRKPGSNNTKEQV